MQMPYLILLIQLKDHNYRLGHAGFAIYYQKERSWHTTKKPNTIYRT